MRTRLIFPAAALFVAALAVAQESPFKGGFPPADDAQKARDEADYQRAVTAYRFWYPTVSCEGIFNGNREKGINDNESFAIMATGPRQVMFTPNSDTPYGFGPLDLKGGPYVVEMPPGPFIGVVDDHHQGWVMDMGLPGPDAGKGGKHLILPPGYKGEVPAGYFVGKALSNKVFAGARSLPVKGDAKGALEALRTIKIYPLATAANPKLLTFVDLTDKPMDATCLRWEDNIQYWQKLYEVIDAEPLVDKFLPMYGPGGISMT